jgi:hypothetical protein
LKIKNSVLSLGKFFSCQNFLLTVSPCPWFLCELSIKGDPEASRLTNDFLSFIKVETLLFIVYQSKSSCFYHLSKRQRLLSCLFIKKNTAHVIFVKEKTLSLLKPNKIHNKHKKAILGFVYF